MQKSSHTSISVQKVAYSLIIIALVGYFLILAKSIITPIIFAVFFTFLLIPLCNWWERWVKWRIPAILLSFLVVLLPLLAVQYIFYQQISSILENIPSISQKLREGAQFAMDTLLNYLPGNAAENRDWVLQQLENSLSVIRTSLGKGVTTSTAILANIFLTLIYVFLLLLYRTGLKQFLILQFKAAHQKRARKVIHKIQQVSRQYLSGLLLVMVLLGVINTLGLWLIGISYAPLWGFLAAFLAIIPYIGTTLGGLLPFIYAMATTGTVWQPIAVVVFYAGVQQVEGNFITPNIIGSSVKINPLTSILALIIGGWFYGVAGLVLALPGIAILRIICRQVDALKPVALLLSNDLPGKHNLFMEKWNTDAFRLSALFKKKN